MKEYTAGVITAQLKKQLWDYEVLCIKGISPHVTVVEKYSNEKRAVYITIEKRPKRV